MYICYRGGDGSNLRGWRFIAPGPAVAVMFVISGFLVTASYERSRGIIKFYIKRIFRIYPALMIVVITPALIYSITGIVEFGLKSFGLYTLKCITYASGGVAFLPKNAIGNGSLWTIPIQMQFYLITPVLYKFVKKNKRVINMSILIFFVMLNLFSPVMRRHLPPVINRIYGLSCIPFVYMYLFGMLCYCYFDIWIPVLSKNVQFIGILYIIVHWILRLDFLRSWEYINPVSAFLIMSFAIGIAYRLGKIKLACDASYGIYLWHLPVVDVLHVVLLMHYSVLMLISVWGIAFLLGVGSWYLIEKPCIKLGAFVFEKLYIKYHNAILDSDNISER